MRKRKRGRQWPEGLADMYRTGRELNHWRHDMQGELEVLYRLQKSGKYAEVEAYIEKLCSGLKALPDLPQPTGNEGLDAALMRAAALCRKRGILFRYAVLGIPERIDSMTMGRLMDNLLRNGMEACQELAGMREIELVVHSWEDGLEIYMENSIGESVLKRNPELSSRKRDKERHGFGMESIFRTVKVFDGIYRYWEEENRFCQCIYLRYTQV